VDSLTAFWAGCYFWLRLAHAAVYLLGVPLVRTITFTLGYMAIAGIFLGSGQVTAARAAPCAATRHKFYDMSAAEKAPVI
jgi:hypothetical protein